MVAAALSACTGLSGAAAIEAGCPLLAVESGHDRRQGIAKEAAMVAVEKKSVSMIEVQAHD